MKKRKRRELKPGEAITVRLPIDTPAEVIQYMNRNRDLSVNAFLVERLLKQCREDIAAEETGTTTIELPMKFSQQLERKLENPYILNMLAQLVYQVLVSGDPGRAGMMRTPFAESIRNHQVDVNHYEDSEMNVRSKQVEIRQDHQQIQNDQPTASQPEKISGNEDVNQTESAADIDAFDKIIKKKIDTSKFSGMTMFEDEDD